MIIAYEAANSFVKIKSARGEESYPNTTRLIDPNEIDVMGSGKLDTVTIDGDTYAIGERRVDEISSTSRDNDRYKSPQFRIESLAAIAKHASNGMKVKVVTGLPASHFQDGTSEQDIEQALIGEHTVKVGDEPRTFEIEAVKVLLQPIGTLMSYLFEEDGTKKRPEEIDTYKAIVDIGWGTTDVAVIDGMRITQNLGAAEAMLDAHNEIIRLLKRKHGAVHGIKSPLWLEARIRHSDMLSAGGREYPIDSEKSAAFKNTANRIMSSIKSQGLALKEFDKVIFTGGGVEALAPYLSSHLGDINATRIKESQLANVRGFYTYGKIKL